MKVIVTEAKLMYPNGILDQLALGSMRNSPMLTTVLRFCLISAGCRGQSHTWVTQGNPNRDPKQKEICLQQRFVRLIFI